MKQKEVYVCNEVRHGTREYLQTVDLRDELLRKPLGLRFSQQELAGECDSFHLVCRQGDRLAGCLVLKPLSNQEIHMRQLAVALSIQNQGIGTQLVCYAETFARERGFERIKLHARESAVGFYKRLGYTKEGEKFIEVTIPHFRMFKKLEEEMKI